MRSAQKTKGQIVREHTLKSAMDNFVQSAGETAVEFGGKFLKELDKAVEKARNKGIKGKIYIQVLERGSLFGDNTVHHTYVTRRSRPTPEQSMYLYSHNEGDTAAQFEYCLPDMQLVPGIFSHIKDFTSKYLEDIRKWLRNELV